MRKALYFAVIIAVALPLAADELSDARAALDALGIKASSTGVVLAKEAELSKELNKAPGLKRGVLQSEKELKAAEQQLETVERDLLQLRQLHVQYSAELANINPNNITLNNKLVGAIKVVEGQFEL